MVSVSINVDKVCRLCLREDDGTFQMTSLYDRLDLEETIRKCVQIEVNCFSFLRLNQKLYSHLFIYH